MMIKFVANTTGDEMADTAIIARVNFIVLYYIESMLYIDD